MATRMPPLETVQSALVSDVDPLLIRNDGLMGGADKVGKRFERGEYFLPELMLAGRALKAAMVIVKPPLLEKILSGGVAPSNDRR